MGGDHVVVVVLREMRVHPITWLRGFSVADAVGKNDVVACNVKKLSGSVQCARKIRDEELMAGAAGAVQNQNRICDAALRVARGLSQRRVMQPQLRQRFARAKLEVLRDIVALRRRGYRSLLRGCGQCLEKNSHRRASEAQEQSRHDSPQRVYLEGQEIYHISNRTGVKRRGCPKSNYVPRGTILALRLFSE